MVGTVSLATDSDYWILGLVHLRPQQSDNVH